MQSLPRRKVGGEIRRGVGSGEVRLASSFFIRNSKDLFSRISKFIERAIELRALRMEEILELSSPLEFSRSRRKSCSSKPESRSSLDMSGCLSIISEDCDREVTAIGFRGCLVVESSFRVPLSATLDKVLEREE